MSIKPTSVYANMLIYDIKIVVNLLHVSVTICGHLQGGDFYQGHITEKTKPMYKYQILSYKYIIHNIR
jgi:hypothetical protein